MSTCVSRAAAALGGDVAGRDTVVCPGPAHSPKDRSLSVKFDPTAPDGFLTFSHAGDDWRECRDHVRRRLDLPAWEPGDEQRRSVPPHHINKWDLAAIEAEANEGPRAWTEDEIIRIERARRIWNEGKEPRGTLAERYLREHRKLDLPDDLADGVLRYHDRCPWKDEDTGRIDRVPALVVPFRSIDNNEITAIHRIRLNSDGTKFGRKMLGIVSRAAIKLDALGGDTLAIGEGVETGMAARELGYGPAWALGSVGAVSFFPLIDNIGQLLILGEAGEVSAKAIKVCGTRWHRAGRRVRVVMPDAPHSDLNDVLIAERSS
jgi:hypothetical protein